MKIVTKDNFNRDLFTEIVVASGVDECFGKQMVEEWNRRYWTERSDYSLQLVEDDYVLYDGYKDLC